MTVDTAIRIVWHSAEVMHFTHKIREAFMSPTIPQYLKYLGEAPDHYLSLDDTNIESTRLVATPVPNISHLKNLEPRSHIHLIPQARGTNGVSGAL